MSESRLSTSSPPTFREAELLRSVANNPTMDSNSPTAPSSPTASSMEPTKGEKSAPTQASTAADSPSSKPAAHLAAAQQLVDHTYTDYAVVDEDDLRLLDENSSLLPKPSSAEEASAREKLKGMSCTYGPMKKNAGGVIQPFPGKLLEVLDRSDLSEIIDWMPHGRSFIVKKPKLFTTEVLPRFFKQTKFLSFTRQLNLWGFKRITKGVDGGSYYHQLFLRGRPYLAMRMKRQKIKGTGMKLTPNPDGEPDFYNKYPPVPQLNSHRILPPLPPLPAEKAGLGGSLFTGIGGAGILDQSASTSKLSFDAGRGDNTSLFGKGDVSNLAAAAENRIRQTYAANHAGSFAGRPGLAGPSSAAYPGASSSGGMLHDDLLLAPGVSSFESASRLRYPGVVGAAPPRGATGLGQTNDPIQDELSAMIRSRNQSAAAASMYPHTTLQSSNSQLSSDRLLMERLRDLDRAAQMKREQQDMSVLHRARLLDDFAAGSSGRANCPTSNPAAATGLRVPPGNSGPFDRYFSEFSQPQRASQMAGQDAFSAAAFSHEAIGPSSVSDALREAKHLEELAMAQRAKARSLALAGALQQRFGMSDNETRLGADSGLGDNRPSFGRPFGRRD